MNIEQEKIILSVLQNPDIRVTDASDKNITIYHVEPYDLDFFANIPDAYRIDIEGQVFDYYETHGIHAAPETTFMYDTMRKILEQKLSR